MLQHPEHPYATDTGVLQHPEHLYATDTHTTAPLTHTDLHTHPPTHTHILRVTFELHSSSQNGVCKAVLHQMRDYSERANFESELIHRVSKWSVSFEKITNYEFHVSPYEIPFWYVLLVVLQADNGLICRLWLFVKITRTQL